MSKKEMNALEVQEKINQLYLTNDEKIAGITWTEAFDFLESMKPEDMKDASGFDAKYLSFEKEGDYHFLATNVGAIKFKDDKEETEVVYLVDRSGQKWVCAATVLVGAIKNVKVLPAMVKVQYLGEEKSPNVKGGYYKNIKVFLPEIKVDKDGLPF